MKKNIIIRQVKKEDAEQYIKLSNIVWRDAYKHIFPEDVFIERENNIDAKIKTFPLYAYNDDTQMIYVAEYKGRIVGFVFAKLISGYSYFAEKGYADLMAIYIHPEYQGEGIASKFKNMFEKWAKENGATKYVIGVLRENHKARKIYEKWGGKLEEYFQPFVKLGVGYDEVFYTYNLGSEDKKEQ